MKGFLISVESVNVNMVTTVIIHGFLKKSKTLINVLTKLVNLELVKIRYQEVFISTNTIVENHFCGDRYVSVPHKDRIYRQIFKPDGYLFITHSRSRLSRVVQAESVLESRV